MQPCVVNFVAILLQQVCIKFVTRRIFPSITPSANVFEKLNKFMHFVYLMIVKALCLQVSTGLKDDDLETQYNLFQEHIIEKPKPYYRYDQSLEPDVWFDAAKVNKTLLLEKKNNLFQVL